MFHIASAGLHYEIVSNALSTLAELGISAQAEDLPELHPADRMEVAMKASICMSFQGGYRDIGTMIWLDPFSSRIQMLRGLRQGLNPNATDCSSWEILNLLVTTQNSMCRQHGQ